MFETAYFESPVGCIEVYLVNNQIMNVQFSKENRQNTNTNSPLMQKCFDQLQEYFDGVRKQFDLPLKPLGTDFQLKVWNKLLEIPYGETTTYNELAMRLNKEKAGQAVGGALGKNPICILIPCHRVIRFDHSTGGYAYGTNIKQRLIDLEKMNR